MSITIVTATRKDAEMIADISRETFYETFADQNSVEDMELFLSNQFTREKLIEEVSDPEIRFLLAYESDEIAGYVKLKEGHDQNRLAEKAIEIARLYAIKKFIGKGVGSALMKASIEFANSRNYEVIWLGVWEHNSHAIEFYKRWGFEKFGETEFLLGRDIQRDWLMKKSLQSGERQ